MKTIGLIGGMSWESSAMYYEIINQEVKKKLGGFHSSKSIMTSVDFSEIARLQNINDWKSLNQLMVQSAKQLENAGADFIILCTNTMHLCSKEIVKNTSIPFLHIANATAERIKSVGLKKIGLLGTKFTMEKDFYIKNLKEFGLETIVPNSDDRKIVNDIIFNELVLGIIKNDSRKELIRIIKDLESKGAQGIILGCTEIPLLITPSDVDIHLFDTARIHAESAVIYALE
ncbi:aspartate/glutamate racemase family protein [Aquimarina pacifica]|uniref:aspartate/glutamate racemase family protein n=1 Tax=Aquimarina pacifica TaxID=1296415 RepID=UPI000470811D|nr:aspartate/glutamate racemase family protein [Aquimarina pacifica]